MNMKKLSAVATFICCLATVGCTTSGRPASDYKDLQLNISYSQTFNLEPADSKLEKIYIMTRDLSGRNASDTLKSYLIYNLRTNSKYMITDNPNEADILIYSTIASISTDAKQGYVGTVAGGVGGLVAGAVIGEAIDNDHYSYDRYGYGYHSSNGLDILMPLVMAGVGAGIGYAIDNSMAIHNMTLREDLEIRQCFGGECQAYTTQMVVRGDQLDMNEADALGAILAHSARGIAELIKH